MFLLRISYHFDIFYQILQSHAVDDGVVDLLCEHFLRN